MRNDLKRRILLVCFFGVVSFLAADFVGILGAPWSFDVTEKIIEAEPAADVPLLSLGMIGKRKIDGDGAGDTPPPRQVIAFVPRAVTPKPRPAPTVTQLALAEIAELRRRRSEIDELLLEKRKEVEAALARGAHVEPGAHKATKFTGVRIA